MGWFDGFKNALSGGNSNSFVARLGGEMLNLDPTNALIKETTGHDWAAAQAKPGTYLADRSNKLLSEIGKPAVKVDKIMNPLRRIPVYDRFATWTEAKPVDTAAAAAGIFFGAGGIAGAGAGGGTGAGAGAGTGAAGGAGGGAAGGAGTGGALVSSQPGVVAGWGAGSGVPGAIGGNAAGAGSVVGGAAGGGGAAAGGGAITAGGATTAPAAVTTTTAPAAAGGGSLYGQAASAGLGLIGNYQNNKAVQDAADALAASADKASQVQWNMYNQSRQDQLPWQQAGSNALAQMMEQMGYGVTRVGQNMMDPVTGKLVETPQFAYSPNAHGQSKMFAGFQADPGYKFRLEQGNKAMQNSQAARGGLLSGNALKAASEYNSGMASQEYGNYWNRLAGLAGVGQTANNQLTSLGQNTANSVGELGLQAGNARASGYAAKGQNNANTFNSLANMAGNYWGKGK